MRSPVTFVAVHDRASVRTITIERSQKKNALLPSMYDELALALDVSKDGSIKCIKLTGSDDCFCSGNDLSAFRDLHEFADLPQRIRGFMDGLMSCPVPVVVAVDGPAVGVGATLLLHCDYVVMSPSSYLKFPFVSLGLCPEFASSLLLPAKVGYVKAAQWLYTGANIDAAEALDTGLINAVEPDVDSATEAVCQVLAKQPLSALVATKRLLKAPTQASVVQAIDREMVAFTEALQGPEFAAAARAFFAKSE